MAGPTIYQNGVGGTQGADPTTLSPLYTPATIWYVGSASGGVDGASPAGQDRQKPLATISQAHTNAAAGDKIVILANHAETLTSALTFNKADISVWGEGATTTRPTFTRNANVILFDVTAAGVVFWNIYLASGTSASALSKIRTAAVSTVVRGCQFDCGANDTGPGFETVTGASQVTVRDTTFTAKGTALTSQPHSAFKVTNALTDLDLDTVVFDGGTYGWSNQYAFNGAAAITRLRGINIDLLGDSDVTLATGTTGHIIPRNKSGSARIVWTP